MNLSCMFNELEHCFMLCLLIDVNMKICGGGFGGGGGEGGGGGPQKSQIPGHQ